LPFSVAIFQTPGEEKCAKSTVKILRNCIECSVWKRRSLANAGGHTGKLFNGPETLILYPGDQAVPVDKLEEETKKRICCVVLFDGTWESCRRMYLANISFLAEAHHVRLRPTSPSKYIVRQQPNLESLSTLEALVELIVQLGVDGAEEKAQLLLRPFHAMVQMQLRHMTTATHRPNRPGYDPHLLSRAASLPPLEEGSPVSPVGKTSCEPFQNEREIFPEEE